MAVLEFSQDNWTEEVENSDQPVVVDFWAPWCGPCRQLSPIFERIADQFEGKVKVGKLNVDDNSDLASKFGVTSIPRVFIMKDGEFKEKITGLSSERDLVSKIKAVLDS